MHRRLLEQMQCLRTTVQNVVDTMEGNVLEGKRRNRNSKTEMCARIDEVLKKGKCQKAGAE